MKIIRFDSDESVALMADSAYRPDRRLPLFVPDGDWSLQVRPAVRVGRLGKAMTPQFALSKHIDAWALVAYLKPAEPNVTADMTDDALCHGLWQDVQSASDAPMPVQINGTTTPVNLKKLLAEGAQKLSQLSQAATFKTGDIIVLPEVMAEMPATPDTDITAILGSSDILNLELK